MSYNGQTRQPNPFRTKNDKKPHRFLVEVTMDNNNNNNCKNQMCFESKKQFKFEHNSKAHSEKLKFDSGCLKINGRSKGVKKGKFKTPAQDRLQKMLNNNKAAVVESLKQMVDLKSTVPNPTETKKPTHASESKEPVASAWSDVFKRTDNPWNQPDSNEFPPLLPSKHFQSFQQKMSSNTNKRCQDVQVQSNSKLDDKSKAIGVKKVKSKTPAQDRLQKFADENKVVMLESLKELVDVPIISDAKNHRKSIGMQKSHVTGIEPSITKVVSKSVTVNNTTDSAYIIPDTNVFLHSLACIKSVVGKDSKYSVLIPYVVLQELDNLKRRGGENKFTVKLNATRAIRYIYELVQAENKRLRGQTAIEDTNRLIDVSSNDDKILNCCLQLIGQSKEVILVTNDLNLTNIAKLSGVETISFRRCLEKFQ